MNRGGIRMNPQKIHMDCSVDSNESLRDSLAGPGDSIAGRRETVPNLGKEKGVRAKY